VSELWTIVLIAWLAGVAAFVGGVVARFAGGDDTETKAELVHGVVAFGGGVLLAAVAFALVPEGLDTLSAPALAASFFAGGFVFCAADAYLQKRGESSAQLMAMLMDFVPEAIALGAVFVEDRALGVLLAALIAAQNLPEGFASYREMVLRSGDSSRKVLLALLGVSLLGPLASSGGYLYLRDLPRLVAAIMVFAGGGITYLVFQDIAPQARMRRHWLPTLGAVAGFACGMLARLLLD